MMKRCTIDDLDHVNRIMTDPEVYPFISDDGSPEPDEFSAESFLVNPSVYVLQPNEGSIFLFIPFVWKVFWIHSCVLPDYRGKIVFKVGRETCDWMFENAGAIKIIGVVEKNNRRACIFSRKIGGVQEGILKNSYVKDGKISDLILFGRENRKCQPQQQLQSQQSGQLM